MEVTWDGLLYKSSDDTKHIAKNVREWFVLLMAAEAAHDQYMQDLYARSVYARSIRKISICKIYTQDQYMQDLYARSVYARSIGKISICKIYRQDQYMQDLYARSVYARSMFKLNIQQTYRENSAKPVRTVVFTLSNRKDSVDLDQTRRLTRLYTIYHYSSWFRYIKIW